MFSVVTLFVVTGLSDDIFDVEHVERERERERERGERERERESAQDSGGYFCYP